MIVYRIIRFQALAVVVLACFLWLTFDRIYALSALLGGLICLVPNIFMVCRAFSYSGARAARNIVRSFYMGEAGKLLLTAVGFAVVFSQVKQLNPLVLFLAYVLVQSVFWFVPLMKTQD